MLCFASTEARGGGGSVVVVAVLVEDVVAVVDAVQFVNVPLS